MNAGKRQWATVRIAGLHTGGKMNARTNWEKWIGTGLIVGLLALLAAANVQAQDPEVAERFLAPAYGIAIHCDTAILEEGDPFMLVDEVDVPCLDVTSAEVSSIEFAGNTAWVWSTASDATELHVYATRDGVWERFPYSSAPDSEYLYMLEQENLSMAVANAWPIPGAAASDVSIDPRGVRYWEQFFELPSAIVERSAAAPNVSIDPRGVRYWEQVFALPSVIVEGSAASPDVSIDVRGESYWDEFFGLQGTAAQPSAVPPSADETSSIDLFEREIDLASGSELNTRADLVLALLNHSWATNAAGEDLSREAK